MTAGERTRQSSDAAERLIARFDPPEDPLAAFKGLLVGGLVGLVVWGLLALVAVAVASC